jgi:hypothetical protein
VKEHTQAIADYAAEQSAGKRSALTRRIATLELDMELAGIAYEPWNAPKPVKRSQSDASLLAKLDTISQLLATRTDLRPALKAHAESEVERYRKMAAKRGLTVPDVKPAPKRKAASSVK